MPAWRRRGPLPIPNYPGRAMRGHRYRGGNHQAGQYPLVALCSMFPQIHPRHGLRSMTPQRQATMSALVPYEAESSRSLQLAVAFVPLHMVFQLATLYVSQAELLRLR